MEVENDNLNDDLNINSLKRGKGRPFGKVRPYKPRLPKELKNNVLNDDEFNLINPIQDKEPVNELNLNDVKEEIKPEPFNEPELIEPIKEHLNLDDLKNKEYVY